MLNNAIIPTLTNNGISPFFGITYFAFALRFKTLLLNLAFTYKFLKVTCLRVGFKVKFNFLLDLPTYEEYITPVRLPTRLSQARVSKEDYPLCSLFNYFLKTNGNLTLC